MRLPVAIHSLGRKLAWTDETVIVCIVWLKAPRESGCMLQKQAAAKNDRDRTVQALPCLGLHLRICEATLDFEMWLEGFICSRLHVPVVHTVFCKHGFLGPLVFAMILKAMTTQCPWQVMLLCLEPLV